MYAITVKANEIEAMDIDGHTQHSYEQCTALSENMYVCKDMNQSPSINAIFITFELVLLVFAFGIWMGNRQYFTLKRKGGILNNKLTF